MASRLTLPLLLLLTSCGGDPSDGRGGRTTQPPPVLGPAVGHSNSSMVFASESQDFGEVFQHRHFDLDFSFEVQGKDDVVVDALTASCGCTDVALHVEGKVWEMGKPIPAGSKGRIVGTFDSRDYVDVKTSSIKVEGAGANLPIRLNVSAKVKPVFSSTPHMARFVDLLVAPHRRNERPTRQLQVTGSEPFTITGWKDLPTWVTIQDTGKAAAPDGVGEVHTLEVSLDPAISAGRHSTLAVAETSIGQTLTFQVYAEIHGKVRYFPDRLVGFNVVEQGKSPERILRMHGSVDWLDVPEPTVTYEGSSAFDAFLDVKKLNKEYALIVQLQPDAEPGRHTGKISVTWPEGSDIESREFPISALVREKR